MMMVEFGSRNIELLTGELLSAELQFGAYELVEIGQPQAGEQRADCRTESFGNSS
jgi:hypothetical protein